MVQCFGKVRPLLQDLCRSKNVLFAGTASYAWEAIHRAHVLCQSKDCLQYTRLLIRR